MLSFLSMWEGNYTFCFITENKLVRESLAKRDYNPNEHNHMRIGIKEETGTERFARMEREKASLPRTARRKEKVSFAAKASVKKKIRVRKEKLEREAAE